MKRTWTYQIPIFQQGAELQYSQGAFSAINCMIIQVKIKPEASLVNSILFLSVSWWRRDGYSAERKDPVAGGKVLIVLFIFSWLVLGSLWDLVSCSCSTDLWGLLWLYFPWWVPRFILEVLIGASNSLVVLSWQPSPLAVVMGGHLLCSWGL